MTIFPKYIPNRLIVIHPKSTLVEKSGIKKLPADKPITATLIATDYYLFNLPVKFFSLPDDMRFNYSLEDRVSIIGFRLVQRLVESPDETGKTRQCVSIAE